MRPGSFRRKRNLFGRPTVSGDAAEIEDDPAFSRLLLARKKLDVEAVADTLVVSYGRLIDPEQARELLADAKEILARLSSWSG